jgi:putative PIN family toxin of toxin-antitoxin system
MRIFVDTNIFISYLLSQKKDSFVPLLFDKIAKGEMTLLVSRALLDEIEATVQKKPKLLQTITQQRLTDFFQLLLSISEEIPLIRDAIPQITRDPTDDFLIAYAVLGQADYLISGDQDLLVMKAVHRVKIVRSGEFRSLIS